MPAARRVADRVVVTDHGAIVEQGPPEQVVQRARHERTRQFHGQLEGAAEAEDGAVGAAQV